ncbi:hypothetical protein DRO58_04025 [Candidatus Bathyarchaeota archaeon]|nr:MAG: hypothetical protein DRO58_04025 [Candidatus Bathyarchaeota archaeon]
MVVEYRVRLSTIVKADSNVAKQSQLCRRIRFKLRRSSSQTIKPIVVIDTVPGEEEQKVAGGFLDYFHIPFIHVLEPEFKFKNNIRKEQLAAFFKSYKQALAWYRERRARNPMYRLARRRLRKEKEAEKE